jgi:hypothetical protein
MSISGFDNHPINAENANMNQLIKSNLAKNQIDNRSISPKKDQKETKSLLL